MSSSVCYSDIGDTKPHLIDLFSSSGTSQNEYGSGDVGLFESASTSGRFRTASSSSVSFSAAGLSSCDIFPEIAGIVSASDSETDVSDYLMQGHEHQWRTTGDFVFSPPHPKFRRFSANQSEEPSVTEMLDTLCYGVHDLTHINGVVQNVVLDWQNGAALEDLSRTPSEVIVRTEPSCEDYDVNSADGSLINGFIATLSEGMIASDMNSLLEKFEAETEVTFAAEEDQDVVCCHSAAETSPLDDCNTVPASHQSDATDTRLNVTSDPHCPTACCDLQGPENCGIDVRDVTVGKKRHDTISFQNAMRINIEPKTKKPASRPKKTDGGEICSRGAQKADADQLSEEKRRQMRKKARAISHAIAKKAEQSKPRSSATSIEHSQPASNVLAGEKKCTNDIIRSSAKMGTKQHDSEKSRCKIPHVKNIQVPTDSIGTVGGQPAIVSEASLPLSKGATWPSSSFGWHRSSHATADVRKTGAKASQHPITSHKTVHSKTINGAARLSASPQMVKASSFQRTEGKVDDRIPANPVAAVSNAVPASTLKSSDSSGRDSSQPTELCIPSREMIHKIESSCRQKTAILLPNAVLVRGERGTAVGISVPSQKNLSLTTTQTLTHSSPVAVSTQHNSPVIVSTTPVSSSSSYVSPSHTAASKKRKLNISQYKSMLPQRQKMLLHTPAVVQPLDLPTVYVYGRCKDILHDHDYVGEDSPSTDGRSEPSAENTSVLPQSTGSVTVRDEISRITNTALVTAEVLQDKSRRPATISVVSSEAYVTPWSKPSTSASAAALGLKQYIVSKAGNNRSASGMQDVMVDCMPAYFDVVSLPNRQTKISVSKTTLLTKKRDYPQPVVISDDSNLTQLSSGNSSGNILHHEQDAGHSIGNPVLESTATLLKSHCPESTINVSVSDLTQQSSQDGFDTTVHHESSVCHNVKSNAPESTSISSKESVTQSVINPDDSIFTLQLSEDHSDTGLHRENDLCVGNHVSESTVTQSKEHNALSIITTDDSTLAFQSSEIHSASTLQCENDVSNPDESCVSEFTAAFLLLSHNPQSVTNTIDSSLTHQSPRCHSGNMEKDIGHSSEGYVCESTAAALLKSPQSVTNISDSNLTHQSPECHSDNTKKDVPESTATRTNTHNPQSSVDATDDSDLALRSSEVHSDHTLHREKNSDHDLESRASVSPRRRLESVVVTVENRHSSRSSSISSVVSISSNNDESVRSRSRSRSHSSSETSYSSDSSSSSSSRSRFRGSRSRRCYRQRSWVRSPSSRRYRGRLRDRTSSNERNSVKRKFSDRNMEQRKVVYIGRIPWDYTKHDLRRKMKRFGEIVNSSVHFRNYGDNYGFVTFRHADDAFRAIEKGRTVPGCEAFDFSFGGRRQFCKSNYADLDGDMEWEEEMAYPPSYSPPSKDGDDDFDNLLQQAQRKLRHN